MLFYSFYFLSGKDDRRTQTVNHDTVYSEKCACYQPLSAILKILENRRSIPLVIDSVFREKSKRKEIPYFSSRIWIDLVISK